MKLIPFHKIPRCLLEILTCLVVFVAVVSSPGPAYCFLGMDVRNFSIGGGWNAAFKKSNFPEAPFYTEPNIKKSFLIDLRFDMRLREWLRFVPDLGYWSWGRFPRQGMTGAESSLQCYGLNFDLQVLSSRRGKFQTYGGLGISTHYARQVTDFPYEMFVGRPLVVSEISEKSLKIGPNVSCGFEYHITASLSLFNELRWEIVPGFQQLKILIGITTF